MKVPLIWLNDYIDTTLTPNEIASRFTALGLMLDKPIENNVLDLEHRMDRSDWLSIIGCARDLSAMQNIPLKFPKTYIKKGKTLPPKETVKIDVIGKGIVNRFNTRVFKNISVKPSPNWLRDRLEAYGIPSINNIVDITNFVMVELGQTMHAQDLAKFEKREIIIRQAKKGESITTLLGETVKLDESISVLTQNNTPITITGIVGGIHTSVTDTTTEIVLDAGNYDQNYVRRASRKLKILNESVLRNDKFIHPSLTQIALERATHLILEHAGGEYYENVDYYPTPRIPENINLRTSRIQQISGMDFDMSDIKRILTKLGYSIVEEKNQTLTLEIPIFRTDVIVEDDLVADILRISDYKTIPTTLIDQSPPPESTDPIYGFEDRLRNILVQLGGNEHITEPLTSSLAPDAVKLENSLTSEKSTLRTSIRETLTPIVANYKKHGVNKAFIFEIGKTYHQIKKTLEFDSFREDRELCVIHQDFNSSHRDNSIALGTILSTLISELGIKDFSISGSAPTYDIFSGKTHLGTITNNSFALNTALLLNTSSFTTPIIESFRNHRSLDISLALSSTIPFGPVYSYISSYSDQIIDVKVSEDRVLKSGNRTILLHLTLDHSASQSELISSLSEDLENEFTVKVRK